MRKELLLWPLYFLIILTVLSFILLPVFWTSMNINIARIISSIILSLWIITVFIIIILRHYRFINIAENAIHKDMNYNEVIDVMKHHLFIEHSKQIGGDKTICTWDMRQWRTSIGGGTLTRSVTVHFDEDKKVTQVETKNCHISPISFWLVLQHLGIIGMIWGMFFGLL